MSDDGRRTPDQIRSEIAAEREQLDAKVAELSAEAKRSGRIAGTAMAALGSVLLFVKLRGRSRP
ncbi:MAG: DUF3618 domain-containing protein [Gaiellaceae bacterium]